VPSKSKITANMSEERYQYEGPGVQEGHAAGANGLTRIARA
jgi:hypothetical protein